MNFIALRWRCCGRYILAHSTRAILWWLLAALSAGAVASAEVAANKFPDAGDITQFLDRTISWYRQLAVQQQIATEATDVLVVSDNRQIADQITRLAFEFARAAAALIAKQSSSNASQSGASPEYRSLTQLQSQLDKQVQDIQRELDTDRQKQAVATGDKKQALQSQVAELQGELDLADARREAVHSMVEFVSGASTNGLGATGLRAQIEALAGTVSTTSATVSNGSVPLAVSASANKPDSTSIWDLTAQAFALSAKVHRVEALIRQTEGLTKASQDIRTPLVSNLMTLTTQGDQLANQADTANRSQLAQERQQLDALASQFKQISAAVIPLGKLGVLLDLYQKNLSSWRDTIRFQYNSGLRALGIRAGILALVLILVIAAAELWKRAVYRYVHDSRRRYQFLLIRRFVLWFLIALVLIFALASRIDSFVTFAGLITAGVAVALQNVILSIVGYFFLIGKYGIRAGDRVQIGDVAGEVIDVGLVRLHLMELGGDGEEGPTGRVVAFSNSIVFQSSGGLFKQLPGIHFAWHDITLTLAPTTDAGSIKERFLRAVDTVLIDYKEEIERQDREIERTAISISGSSLRPRIQLRFVAAGIEVTIRYPVDLKHAGEIDERISQELLQTLDREPKLKLAGAGSPDMKLRTDLTG